MLAPWAHAGPAALKSRCQLASFLLLSANKTLEATLCVSVLGLPASSPPDAIRSGSPRGGPASPEESQAGGRPSQEGSLQQLLPRGWAATADPGSGATVPQVPRSEPRGWGWRRSLVTPQSRWLRRGEHRPGAAFCFSLVDQEGRATRRGLLGETRSSPGSRDSRPQASGGSKTACDALVLSLKLSFLFWKEAETPLAEAILPSGSVSFSFFFNVVLGLDPGPHTR